LLIPSISILIISDSLTLIFSFGGVLLLLYGVITWKVVLNIEEKSWLKSQLNRYNLLSQK
jgi:hypothetical protein